MFDLPAFPNAHRGAGSTCGVRGTAPAGPARRVASVMGMARVGSANAGGPASGGRVAGAESRACQASVRGNR